MAKINFVDENIRTLSDELAEDIKNYGSPKIENYILKNISKNLREYQKTALEHYLKLKERQNTKRHLMFNMATGSGKTLIMASLILESYRQGYRNFIFFVNSTAILEKTRANFCDQHSGKYLFSKDIIIDNKRIKINPILNLDDSKKDTINIYFNTIQGLFSLFTYEKENSLTLQDLKDKKLVFLADEAHHLNVDTNKQKSDDEKSCWEGVINEAFKSCDENILLEFSATIPKINEVLKKYKDKIVYKYDLRKFCKDGYSKRIFLIKYENTGLKYRFFGAMILSVYRQILASKHNMILKPIILFKSEKIQSSKDNEKLFLEILENLNADELLEFYENIKNNELFKFSYDFFKCEFGINFIDILIKLFKSSFKDHIINVNDENEAEKNQILLNTLEENNNEVRVIFAVDKLNEGWDVLNLFDIVRLGNKSSSKITTKEAQLIGRGARYFPFTTDEFGKDMEFKRKYDENILNELSMLERLTYHTINDVDFISSLNKTMKESGLFIEHEEERIILEPSNRAKQIVQNNKIFYITNQRIKRVENLFNFNNIDKIKQRAKTLKRAVSKINIPLFSNNVTNMEIFIDENLDNNDIEPLVKPPTFGDKIYYTVFLKAINILGLSFSDIKNNFALNSKKEFFDEISQIPINFSKNQKFDRVNQLEIAKFVLQNLQNLILDDLDKFDATSFKEKELIELGQRAIIRRKNKVVDSRYEWLYYDKYSYDSELEKEFLDFIDVNKDMIDYSFKEWIIFRNDGFREFKLYDNRENEPTYTLGFEPDFVFFGIRKSDINNEGILKIECFLEVKGEIFAGNERFDGIDKWKEEFLKQLDGKDYGRLQTAGFPFFKKTSNEEFKDKFLNFFK